MKFSQFFLYVLFVVVLAVEGVDGQAELNFIFLDIADLETTAAIFQIHADGL